MSNAIVNNASLQDIATAIREKGGASGTMYPSEMAANIRRIGGGTYQQKTVHPSTSSQIVTPDNGYDALSQVTVEAMVLQAKTARAGAQSQVVTPDPGKDGLSQVTVDALELQSKTVRATSQEQTITPDSGKDGLSQVIVSALELQTKSVNPSTIAQTVTPDSGKDGLSQVTVAAATLQQKSVTPGQTSIEVTPDNGYYGLSKVTVAAGGGGSGIDLLWTNSSPTEDFSAQTVSIDLSAYGAVVIHGKINKTANGDYLKSSVNNEIFCVRQFLTMGDTGYLLFGARMSDSSFPSTATFREVTVSSSGVVFGAGMYQNSGIAAAQLNAVAIPLYIYGIKGTVPSS